MKYKSTRGQVKGLTFEEVLLSGYATDGGLFVPESVPTLNLHELKTWSTLSYQDLLLQIIPYFISAEEIPFDDLESKYT